jgi:hypothetical protein
MCADDGVDDGQSQSRPAEVPSTAGIVPPEPVEGMLQSLGAEPRPAIHHGKEGLTVLAAQPDGNLAIGWGVDEGVRDQISHRLEKPVGITQYEDSVLDVSVKRAMRISCPAILDGIADERAEISFLSRHRARLIEVGQNKQLLNKDAHSCSFIFDPPP